METPEIVKDVLAHHGVKGQKWGVRRKATVGAQEVVVSDKRRKDQDFWGKRTSRASRSCTRAHSGQVAKKSGIKALSNEQLQEYNNRLNLEQNTKRLMYEDSVSTTQSSLRTLLRQTGSKRLLMKFVNCS